MLDSPIRRGDIYYVDKYDGQYGSETHSGRPGIIVSNNACNATSAVVEVVYTTTKPKKSLPTHVKINSTSRESIVLCEQVTSVSVDRLGTYVGRCTDEEMEKISDAIVISLALKDRLQDMLPEKVEKPAMMEDLTGQRKELEADIARLTVERDTFKEMYDRLLDRLVGKH